MSSPRFLRKLSEQLSSLKYSCAGYDNGMEHEAIRVAVTLRVLFHNTSHSKSLMAHLKMSSTMMLSSSVGHDDWKDYVGIVINLASATPVLCRPKLGSKFTSVPASKWWGAEPVYKFEGREYFRRNLILAAANQDGGAHVDEKLERFYEDLAKGDQGLGIDGAGLVYANGAPYDQSKVQTAPNTHLAMIRQFAHEVLASAAHFRWLQ